ncbi:MAG: (2Fe-2S)-binding protein [Acetobacteraceae bacterium]
MIALKINGRDHQLDIEEDTPLLWALRDHVGLTGAKLGCGKGLCGACSVLLDGKLTRSCVTPLGAVAGRSILTIEGLSSDRSHPVQRAWIAERVPQCGYCQSGMIIAAVALLRRKPRPTDSDIDAAMTNICRCGTYEYVRRAVHHAAALGSGDDR